MAVTRASSVSVKKDKSNTVTDLEAELSSPAVALSRAQSCAGLDAQTPPGMLVLFQVFGKALVTVLVRYRL